jgi:very-short-patch-repair endonuclease
MIHNTAPLTKPVDERRINVADSRPKEKIWLFHSVQMADLRNHSDLRYKLINHFENYRLEETIGKKTISMPPRPRLRGGQPKPFDSWFEVDVYNDIILKGFGVIAQYEVAKCRYRIDLVVILPNGTKIAIECDGDYWHSAGHYEKDMMRQRELERFGWQFFRVRGSTYYANRKKALEPLWEMLPDLSFISPEPTENKKSDISADTPTSIDTQDEMKLSESQTDLFGDTDNAVRSINNDPQRTQRRRRQEVTSSKKGEFLIFTNQFNVYKLNNIGYTSTQALEKIKAEFEQGEKKVCVPILVKEKEGFLIIAFENGKMAKVDLSEYHTVQNRRKLTKAYNNLSKLVSIEYYKNETDLVAISAAGKILVFNTETISTQGRNAQGVKVIKLNNGSALEKVKKLANVSFSNPEYYKFKTRGAGGNKLLKGDMLMLVN